MKRRAGAGGSEERLDEASPAGGAAQKGPAFFGKWDGAEVPNPKRLRATNHVQADPTTWVGVPQ